MRKGRRRRSAEQWRELIVRQERSGLSRVAFCREEGIARASFEKWRSRLAAGPTPAAFVDLTPGGEGSSVWAVEVELPGGMVLRLRG